MFKDRTLYKVLFCILILYTGIFRKNTTLGQLNTEPYSAILFTGKRSAAAVRRPVPAQDLQWITRRHEIITEKGRGIGYGQWTLHRFREPG